MAKGYIAGIGTGGGGGGLPTDPVFNSVTAGIYKSDTYFVINAKDGLALQDAEGDFAYWSRAQGLQLEGQGAVNALISSKTALEFKADSITAKDHHSNVIFSTAKFLELEQAQPYRTIDSILGGLTEAIAAENSQLRAITKLTSTLYSFGRPSSGKISISNPSEKLGLLPPTESEGYGVLYFDYAKGTNVNMVLLKWEDEDGAIYEGVVSESTWHKWGKSVSVAAINDYMLSYGLATGNLFVNEIKVG